MYSSLIHRSPPCYELINDTGSTIRSKSTLPYLDSLLSGQELRSRNGRFRLCMQDDGNLVLYSGTHPIWSSRTHIKGQPPYRLVIQEDNQLCILDNFGEVTWASDTPNEGAPGARAKLGNNGNFILYDGNGKTSPLWCTGTDGGRKALESHQGSGFKVFPHSSCLTRWKKEEWIDKCQWQVQVVHAG